MIFVHFWKISEKWVIQHHPDQASAEVLSKVFCANGNKLTVSWFIKVLKSMHPLTAWKSSDQKASSSRSSHRTTAQERPSFKSLHKSAYLRSTSSTQRDSLAKSACEDSRPIDARRYDAFVSSIRYDFDASRDECSDAGGTYDFYDLYRGSRSVDRRARHGRCH